MLERLLALASRIRACFSGARLDEDLDREIDEHLALLTDDYVGRGMAPEEARRAARMRFGGTMQAREGHRDARGWPLVDATLQDVRYAVRALRRNPAFAIVAAATLAVGLASATTVAALADAILVQPLPYRDPGRLVRMYETNPLKRWDRNIASPANYADWKARNTVFSGMAAYEQFTEVDSGATDMYLTGLGEPQALKSVGVSGDLFRVLGAPALLGRTFTDDETFEGKARVAILSYGLWQSLFAGDPAVIGRTITLNGRAVDVVGVMPREFFFPGRDVQLWVPFGYAPGVFQTSRRPHWLGVIARLTPGVSIQRAQQEMTAIAKRLEAEYPDTNTQMGVLLEGFHESLSGDDRPAMLMLVGAVLVMFLIVCVNIANLQFGRAVSRAHELAIRRALGAGRARLVRQLVTEALVLAGVGGAAGLLLAVWARAALVRFAPAVVPLYADFRFDRTALVFGLALAVIAPLLFGVAPALSGSRADRLTERVKTGSRPARSIRSVLVACEVGLSVVLVVGALLLVRSLLRLQRVDPGFRQEQTVAFSIELPSVSYPDAGRRLQAFQEIERRLAAQPGVQAVGATSTLALRGASWTGDTTVEGRAPNNYERETRHESVTPGYFAVMGIRLLEGRLLDQRDTYDAPRVTLVNETLAKRYFRDADAVGQRITFGRPQDHASWVIIVGVVADEKQDGMDKPVEPEVYVPIAQQLQNRLTFVVRSSFGADAALAVARRQVRSVDKDLALTDITTIDDLVRDSMRDQRFRTLVLCGFAALALFLAALGIYGVLAYFVSQRSRELGIRLALGARPGTLFRMVVVQGMRPVVGGAAAGLAAAVALAGLMRSLLFGIEPVDAPAFAAAAAGLILVALAACAVPARRATRVDPIAALRDE